VSHVFLIGYMGSGKSTLGRSLADALGLPFHDLDSLIEQQATKSVAEVIRQEGEQHFRAVERGILQELLGLPSAVVACGGGTPCFFDNLERMKEAGTIVYLRLTPQQLTRRLNNGVASRPLLDGIAPDALEEHIARHLSARQHFYKQAHVMWDAERSDLSELVELVRSDRFTT
jgi:shikimate kinase